MLLGSTTSRVNLQDFSNIFKKITVMQNFDCFLPSKSVTSSKVPAGVLRTLSSIYDGAFSEIRE